MSTVTHTSIPKNVSTQNDLDYHFLKQIGIEYIQSLGGSLWTDFNEHDPGVTMLEMLCYAITDLGNRIDLPIEDLIAKKDLTSPYRQFHEVQDVLPTRPVTELDYRKLFIDVDCVRNCWLMPHKRTVYVNCKDNQFSYKSSTFDPILPQYKKEFDLKGLYDVLIDFDIPASYEPGSPEYLQKIEEVKQAVRDSYQANRNLCEDLIDISEIEPQGVSVCATIEVERDADENRVHALVQFAIEQYFSPAVRFYTLKEMLDKGYRMDEIFDGPLLEHGFIDTGELKDSSLRTEVRLSDIMNIISSIEGVKVIKEITLGNCDDSEKDEWLICIGEKKRPVLCTKSAFSYSKDVLPLVLSDSKVEAYLAALREEARQHREDTAEAKNVPDLPEGSYLDTDWYTTIQNDFPDTYGIGRYGLPATASVMRHSQAKQLKAYLLFFDQILASYFAQLGIVGELLSLDDDQDEDGKPALARTYYTQAVLDIKDFSDLVPDTDYYPTAPEDMEKLSENLIGKLDDIDGRRNQLLDHLLARFAERFSEYTFLMQQIYGSASTELIVRAKRKFLKDYRSASKDRGGAFNYYHQPEENLWLTPGDPNPELHVGKNVAGAERRIARLSGFREGDEWRHNVSSSYVEIYPFVNSDSQNVFRWRIRDDDGNILLTSTDDFITDTLAMAELHLAVLHIIQTEEEAVENAELADNETVGNLYVRISELDQYSFDVINLDVDNPHFVIARQYTEWPDKEALRTSMLDIIRFMKERFSEEGIFIVEHMLLRPDVHDDDAPMDLFIPAELDDCIDCMCVDQYSYRVSVVLPGYTYRFGNIDFRRFMENLIREELPSHILPKICWVGERRGSVPDEENDLWQFEDAYRKFLLSRTNSDQAQDPVALKAFIKALKQLNTIYPTGRLLECEPGGTPDGKIILGRTNLGTL